MNETQKSIMSFASNRGISTQTSIESNVKSSMNGTNDHVQNNIQQLIDEGKLYKMFKNGQEIICASAIERWDHEDSRYHMDDAVSADVRRALVDSSGANEFKEAFDEMYASKMKKKQHETRAEADEERRTKKFKKNKNRTNTHLD